jgi:hypothetical protein
MIKQTDWKKITTEDVSVHEACSKIADKFHEIKAANLKRKFAATKNSIKITICHLIDER